MSEGLGIQGAVQRVAAQSPASTGATSAAPSKPAAPKTAAQQPTSFSSSPATVASPGAQTLLHAQVVTSQPGLVRVPLPPRPADQPALKPKRAAAPLQSPRDLAQGNSPLAGTAVADTSSAVALLGEDPEVAVEGRAARQGDQGADQLPSRHGLLAVVQSPRGEKVYLERDRWAEHIRPAHITEPPMARGKRQTTWWPVQYSATGQSSMNEQQVVGVITDAVSKGTWMNAPRGTLLSVYDLPKDQADEFGVSEVKVSVAPNGRILSAYPSAGSNVLAVRELNADELSQQAQQQATMAQQSEEGDTRMFATKVAQTTFG